MAENGRSVGSEMGIHSLFAATDQMWELLRSELLDAGSAASRAFLFCGKKLIQINLDPASLGTSGKRKQILKKIADRAEKERAKVVAVTMDFPFGARSGALQLAVRTPVKAVCYAQPYFKERDGRVRFAQGIRTVRGSDSIFQIPGGRTTL